MLGGLELDRFAERRDPAAFDLGEREARMGPPISADRDSASRPARLPSPQASPMRPASASLQSVRISANNSRPVPDGRRRRVGRRARCRGRRRPLRASPVRRIEPDDVAVANPGERAVGQRLGRDVDRRRHFAARAGHAAVGDQRDPVAAVLEHAQRGRQLVQLGHAVGARALEAHDHRDVAVELARLERLEHLILVGKAARRRFDRPALLIDRAGLEDRPAEIALRPAACRRRPGTDRWPGGACRCRRFPRPDFQTSSSPWSSGLPIHASIESAPAVSGVGVDQALARPGCR